PSTTATTISVTASGTDLQVDTNGGGTPEIDATHMEALAVQLGNGGDTVTLAGNLGGTGLASITIGNGTGAGGNDTLDARTLTSAIGINGNLGGGDDTFKAANVVANDSVNADANGVTGDTADYSAATAAVSIDLGAGTASGTSVGNDTITNFENAVGGTGGDTFRGTTGANAFTGNGGV